MIWKTIILLSFALYVFGDGHHAISEQRIKIIHKDYLKEYHKEPPKEPPKELPKEEPEEEPKEYDAYHGELSHIGSKKPEYHEEYAWSYPSYEFSYKVHDPHTHDIKGQEESRDGDEVKGEYWLLQPDGLKRTVSYKADKHSGFHAIVHFSEHDHKKEEEGGEEGGEAKEEGGEEGGEAKEEGGEEGGEVKEESEGEEEKKSEESDHDDKGKWLHDRYWGHHGYNKHREEKHDYYYKVHEDAERRREDEHRDVPVFGGLGTYGRRHSRERADWHGHDGRRDKYEESRRRPQHRSFDERPARPTTPLKPSGLVVRENYYHPRFNRQSQHQRLTTHQ